jgi:hypothetical protein
MIYWIQAGSHWGETMTEVNFENFVSTNIRVFYSIAKESYAEMVTQVNANRRPKPNGEIGWIISYDPERKSFKSALITIAFCSTFLESLLHQLIVSRKGLKVCKENDSKTYEEKLKILDCNDQAIIYSSGRLRSVRKEIVHEKAHLNQNNFRVAQDEATMAIEFIDKVIEYFRLENLKE